MVAKISASVLLKRAASSATSLSYLSNQGASLASLGSVTAIHVCYIYCSTWVLQRDGRKLLLRYNVSVSMVS